MRQLLLLGLLRREDMHGYRLNEFIQRDLAVCTDLKKPTAYYELNKMAAKGWIEQSSEQVGNRPPRRVYRLTPAGERTFQKKLRRALAAHRTTYFEDDVPLAFLDELTPTEAASLLHQRRRALADELDGLQAVPRHRGSIQWMLEHRLRHLQAELAWLDELITRLSTQPENA